MLFQNVPCIYKLSKMVIVWIASVNMHVSQGNSINSVFWRLWISFLLCVCVCVLWLPKNTWYWPPTLKCPALGKRSRQRYCVQNLSSSGRLIADDSQDLPMNTRVLCVYTCVTYLSVLITSWQVGLRKKKKKNREKGEFRFNFSSANNKLINVLTVSLEDTDSKFLQIHTEQHRYIHWDRFKCTYTKKKRVQTWSVFGTTQMSPCLCRSGDVIAVI